MYSWDIYLRGIDPKSIQEGRYGIDVWIKVDFGYGVKINSLSENDIVDDKFRPGYKAIKLQPYKNYSLYGDVDLCVLDYCDDGWVKEYPSQSHGLYNYNMAAASVKMCGADIAYHAMQYPRRDLGDSWYKNLPEIHEDLRKEREARDEGKKTIRIADIKRLANKYEQYLDKKTIPRQKIVDNRKLPPDVFSNNESLNDDKTFEF